ncbi:MAG: spore coat protein [Peptococcaceae bacterium]|nr:spore coat protein [Peptococcaceae bacterium]
MTNIIQNVAGVDFMTEKDIVTELLLTTKSALSKYSSAISESTTPEVRETMRRHLNTIIDGLGQITDYALAKGYYHPLDPPEQFKDDLKGAYMALDLEAWKLQQDEELSGREQEDTPILRS